MSGGPSFTDFLRAADDSDLDAYEMRYLWRVWRRGDCWESVRKTHETTGISIGKVSAVRQSLLVKGWLEQATEGGRVVYRVAIPNVVNVHTVNTDDVIVHTVNGDVHTVNGSVHVVDALPLIEQQEDYPIKYFPAPEVDPELIAAREATFGLIAFWEELTKRKRPDDETLFREKWLKSFNEIWIACGRNLDVAKAKVQTVRNNILAGGGRIFDPSKLPAHVQALVDVELLPMTAAFSGNGRANGRGPASTVAAPVVLKQIAPGLY